MAPKKPTEKVTVTTRIETTITFEEEDVRQAMINLMISRGLLKVPEGFNIQSEDFYLRDQLGDTFYGALTLVWTTVAVE